jgi:hypothetical protein
MYVTTVSSSAAAGICEDNKMSVDLSMLFFQYCSSTYSYLAVSLLLSGTGHLFYGMCCFKHQRRASKLLLQQQGQGGASNTAANDSNT